MFNKFAEGILRSLSFGFTLLSRLLSVQVCRLDVFHCCSADAWAQESNGWLKTSDNKWRAAAQLAAVCLVLQLATESGSLEAYATDFWSIMAWSV